VADAEAELEQLAVGEPALEPAGELRGVRGEVRGGVGVADDGAIEVGEVLALVVILEGGDLVFAEAGLLGDADVVCELVLAAADLGDAEDGDLAQSRREREAAGEERCRHAQPAAEELRVVGHYLEDVEDADFGHRLGESFVEFAELFGVGFVDEGDDGH